MYQTFSEIEAEERTLQAEVRKIESALEVSETELGKLLRVRRRLVDPDRYQDELVRAALGNGQAAGTDRLDKALIDTDKVIRNLRLEIGGFRKLLKAKKSQRAGVVQRKKLFGSYARKQDAVLAGIKIKRALDKEIVETGDKAAALRKLSLGDRRFMREIKSNVGWCRNFARERGFYEKFAEWYLLLDLDDVL